MSPRNINDGEIFILGLGIENMKVLSYRTTMPFANRDREGMPSISPSTSKSTIPFNNVTTIQDILEDRKKIGDVYPHAGGDWSPGKDVSKDYKDKGDDYKRTERDLDILNRLLDKTTDTTQKWKIKTPGGSITFISFELARKYLRENKLPLTYLARVAQSNSSAVTSEGRDRVEVIAESLEKCFMVESIDPQNGVKETGSAFCIAPNYFVTCAHVLKSYNKNEIMNNDYLYSNILLNVVKDEKRYKAKVVDVNLEWDIALISSNITVEPFKLSDSVDVGDDIIVIGSPHGYENNVSTGTVGSLDRTIYSYPGSPHYMFVDLSVLPGNSGGPIIKESTGEVIGMVTLIVSGGSDYGLNAGISSSYIEEFCGKYIKLKGE